MNEYEMLYDKIESEILKLEYKCHELRCNMDENNKEVDEISGIIESLNGVIYKINNDKKGLRQRKIDKLRLILLIGMVLIWASIFAVYGNLLLPVMSLTVDMEALASIFFGFGSMFGCIFTALKIDDVMVTRVCKKIERTKEYQDLVKMCDTEEAKLNHMEELLQSKKTEFSLMDNELKESEKSLGMKNYSLEYIKSIVNDNNNLVESKDRTKKLIKKK